jgi:hypothetical protein
MATTEQRGKTYIDPDIRVADVHTDDVMLWITLTDGRVIGSPLAWSPRLAEATPEQRAQWELMGGGTVVHWPAIDEHISARVLLGHPS